ncbi:hypothetical protein BKA70DRAFT_763423 [Coprinopsis sp. MPI-PUGE-AT-0042]|nr:hypothetical protein BKA70DRAFT_763423 [Coprinopsis sp. MPI-PUGE-AT-0042]
MATSRLSWLIPSIALANHALRSCIYRKRSCDSMSSISNSFCMYQYRITEILLHCVAQARHWGSLLSPSQKAWQRSLYDHSPTPISKLFGLPSYAG